MMSRLHWDHKTDFHQIYIGTLLTTVGCQLYTKAAPQQSWRDLTQHSLRGKKNEILG